MKEQNIHPLIFDLKSNLQKKKLARRQFIRYSTLLGLSITEAFNLLQLTRPQKALAVSYGGKLKVSGTLTNISHPAQAKWLASSQIIMNIGEYNIYTDTDNITLPYLLQN
jgi:peptide/nickel transport system substrate-binding protein